MFLLDTNVLSATAPTKKQPDHELRAWMGRNSEQLFLSVITLMELSHGLTWLQHRAARAKADALRRWIDLVRTYYADRILEIETLVAIRAGELITRARSAGVQIGAEDALIGATAQVHSLTVLTANTRHFAPTGVRCLDPFESLPPEAADLPDRET